MCFSNIFVRLFYLLFCQSLIKQQHINTLSCQQQYKPRKHCNSKQSLKMIKNLTKPQYYRQKNIPQVSICRRLEPEVSVRNHLIEMLGRLGTQIEKINERRCCQNGTNLELANALKIIHELEYQLEIVSSKFYHSQEELLEIRSQRKELERQIVRLEEKVSCLEGTMQKNDFAYKAKFQSDKEHYYAVVSKYEKKIEELNTAYDQLKNYREKQFQKAQQFHENNITNVQTKIKQFENIAQADMKNFKKQLQKATKQNSSMRQKITDLQTCNQQHLCQLQKMNTVLSQQNMKIKCDYEHRMSTLQTELELARNKVKQLSDQRQLWENRYRKQAKIWLGEKQNDDKKHAENQQVWKNNYEEIVKQKQKVIIEVNKKIGQINEKQKQRSNLADRIRKLERQIVEMKEEKNKNNEYHQRSKKQLKDNLQQQHQMKVNDLVLQYQRKLSQQIFKAIDGQKKQVEERYRVQITKYIENIRVLEEWKYKNGNQLRVAEDERRKIQSVLEQIRIENEFGKRSSKEEVESLKSQINTLVMQYQHRLQLKNKQYLSQCDRLKAQHGASYHQLQQNLQQKLREQQQGDDVKNWQIKEQEAKSKKLMDQLQNDKVVAGNKIKSYEICIGQLKHSNEGLVRGNRELVEKVQQLELNTKKNEHQLQQQLHVRQKNQGELKRLSEVQNSLKIQLEKCQIKNSQVIKKLEHELLEMRRKESSGGVEKNSLLKRLVEFQNRQLGIQQQVKKLENEKMEYQKKLYEKDTNLKQKWQTIQSDFQKINQKNAQQSLTRQKQLKEIIRQKEHSLTQIQKKMQQLSGTLLKQRNELQSKNIHLLTKYRQLEQTNKKYSKSHAVLQNVEKQISQKTSNLKIAMKDIEKYVKGLQLKEKQINQMQKKIIDYEAQVNMVRADNVVKANDINRLQNQLGEMSKAFDLIKLKLQRENEQASKNKNSKDEEMSRFKIQIHNIQKKLEEEQNKQGKVYEEKKKLTEKIYQQQSEYELEAIAVKEYKMKITKQIAGLEGQKEQLQSKYKQLLGRYEREKSEQSTQLEGKTGEIKNFQKMVLAYQSGLLELRDANEVLKKKYSSQKQQSSSLHQKIVKMEQQRIQVQKTNKILMEDVDKLRKCNETNEKEKKKICEENEVKVNLAKNEIKSHYENQISRKNKEIETMNHKIKGIVNQEREEYRKKQNKLNEEKHKLFKQIHEKTTIITQIQIKYEGLQKNYEQVCRELEIYKKKWRKMFSEFADNNEQLTQITVKGQDGKSEIKKVVKEFHEIKTERTEKMASGDNKCLIPINQNTNLAKTQDGKVKGEQMKTVTFGQQSESSAKKINNKVMGNLNSNMNNNSSGSGVVQSPRSPNNVVNGSSNRYGKFDFSSASSNLSKDK